MLNPVVYLPNNRMCILEEIRGRRNLDIPSIPIEPLVYKSKPSIIIFSTVNFTFSTVRFHFSLLHVIRFCCAC